MGDGDGSGGARARAQGEVLAWFEATYRRRGLRYLRPYAAYPIFLQLLDARPGQELLDVGCGAGHLLRAANERGVRATGADLAAAAAEFARSGVPDARVVRANGEELCFADHAFDLVTCIGTLERFLEPRKALAEMRRVARDGARFCIMVRNAATLGWALWSRWRYRSAGHGHHDARTLVQWRALFAECGFVVDAVHGDQWQRQKLRRLLRPLGARPGVKEPVARPLLLPLRFANEFIFLLRKAR